MTLALLIQNAPVTRDGLTSDAQQSFHSNDKREAEDVLDYNPSVARRLSKADPIVDVRALREEGTIPRLGMSAHRKLTA